MKPAPFSYVNCASAEEAVAQLTELGDEAKVLAGGQSLVPMMNMRMARPTALVDVSRAADMSQLRIESEKVVIGAAVSQLRAERSAELTAALPIMPEALAHVGHVPIRSRGTVGGSVAHADPAAEMPAVMLALDAEMKVQSNAGIRTVAAADFFVTHFTTVLEPDEVLVEIEIPRSSRRRGMAFLEVARRHGDFALVGAAAVVEAEDGLITSARVVLSGVSDVPLTAAAAERAAIGAAIDGTQTMQPLEDAAREGLEPSRDIHASERYRRKVSGVLVRRAVEFAARRAAEAGATG